MGIRQFEKRVLFWSFGIAMICQSRPMHDVLDHNGLFNDLKTYKKTRGVWHAGHLYEHMVWVSKAMQQMFDTHSKWLEGIDPREERLMIIAAFMHDIGKAGDGQRLYEIKETHPRVGFEYLMGVTPFYLDDARTKIYNFDAWCQQLGLTQEDRATVAVLIGMHQEFGHVLKGVKEGQAMAALFEKYLATLKQYVQEADYNHGIVDERIVRMSLALFRADVCGMHRVDCAMNHFSHLEDEPETLAATRPRFYTFLDSVGYQFSRMLIDYYKQTIKIAAARVDKKLQKIHKIRA